MLPELIIQNLAIEEVEPGLPVGVSGASTGKKRKRKPESISFPLRAPLRPAALVAGTARLGVETLGICGIRIEKRSRPHKRRLVLFPRFEGVIGIGAHVSDQRKRCLSLESTLEVWGPGLPYVRRFVAGHERGDSALVTTGGVNTSVRSHVQVSSHAEIEVDGVSMAATVPAHGPFAFAFTGLAFPSVKKIAQPEDSTDLGLAYEMESRGPRIR